MRLKLSYCLFTVNSKITEIPLYLTSYDNTKANFNNPLYINVKTWCSRRHSPPNISLHYCNLVEHIALFHASDMATFRYDGVAGNLSQKKKKKCYMTPTYAY